MLLPWPCLHVLGKTRDLLLQELPGSIRSVGVSARVLDASNNKLASLSPAVGDLVNLQRLILANNLLTSLQYIEPLVKLKATSSTASDGASVTTAAGQHTSPQELTGVFNVDRLL